MYTSLPLFHANALLGSMVLDAKFALGEKFSASRFFDECRKHDAVEFNTLGAMISILLKQPPRADDRGHPVRVVVDAGCQPGAWEQFRDRFGVRIVEWFGMVDAPGILLNDEDKPGAMGKPVAGVEFRVVGEDDNPLPSGQPGELAFRHPKGRLTYYHKLPEETEKSYAGGWRRSRPSRPTSNAPPTRWARRYSTKRRASTASAASTQTTRRPSPPSVADRTTYSSSAATSSARSSSPTATGSRRNGRTGCDR
jgi:acyl-CoA synthetase (AMP-forming)/AMP-acid ligase II